MARYRGHKGHVVILTLTFDITPNSEIKVKMSEMKRIVVIVTAWIRRFRKHGRRRYSMFQRGCLHVTIHVRGLSFETTSTRQLNRGAATDGDLADPRN